MTGLGNRKIDSLKKLEELDKDTILSLAQFGIGPAMAHNQVLTDIIRTLIVNGDLEADRIYDRLLGLQGNFNPNAIEDTENDQDYYRSLFIYTLRKSLFGDTRSTTYPTKILAERKKRARSLKTRQVKNFGY